MTVVRNRHVAEEDGEFLAFDLGEPVRLALPDEAAAVLQVAQAVRAAEAEGFVLVSRPPSA